MKSLRLALAQINPTVGDLKGNTALIIDNIKKARKAGAEVVAFPELAVTGYPPEDLLLKPSFIEHNLAALDLIRKETDGITAIVGFVDLKRDIYNAAAIIHDRKLLHIYHKTHLPNYGVFDEVRYFQSGTNCPVFRIGEVDFGVSICEDIWYPEGPARTQALAGAEIIININASPYHEGKQATRENMVSTRAVESTTMVAYLNSTGFQDEIVFDGGSFIVNELGEVIARAEQFSEQLMISELDLEGVFRRRLLDSHKRKEAREAEKKVQFIEVNAKRKPPNKRRLKKPVLTPLLSREEEIYSALVLGVRDYIQKNLFKGVLIGLSGGIDSAFVAVVAADALGPKNVDCVFMPSEYTSKISRDDAYELAVNIGVKLTELPITDAFESYKNILKNEFKDRKPDTTEENLQARIRGNLLMALSNKFGHIVLTTGNKSEMSVGYATLYGDMAGGFAVIKDVPKTLLYKLARWRNEQGAGPVIPERIITREPTAELRPDQLDTDSLPPYDVLDPILRAYIEEERSQDEIVATLGIKSAIVGRVIRLIDINEYKRRQSPPGVKITRRAFGKDWRLPITNRFEGHK
jgi:NAD+ synthase (glutamine-hydrolysing)